MTEPTDPKPKATVTRIPTAHSGALSDATSQEQATRDELAHYKAEAELWKRRYALLTAVLYDLGTEAYAIYQTSQD